MTKKELEMAAKLLQSRRILTMAMEKPMVEGIATARDWSYGMAVDDAMSAMHNKEMLAKRTAEEIMRNEAQFQIARIDEELKALGVTDDDN